jgi:hypothetical protein
MAGISPVITKIDPSSDRDKVFENNLSTAPLAN